MEKEKRRNRKVVEEEEEEENEKEGASKEGEGDEGGIGGKGRQVLTDRPGSRGSSCCLRFGAGYSPLSRQP